MTLLFLSYRRSQANAVAPWVQALREAGVAVWQDTREIEALEDFSAGIADALSRAKALLVWYSSDYAESIACQWELTAAFIAAQRAGQPMRRIFIVNPEANADHIVLPAELTNSNYLTPVAGREGEFVAAIGNRLADIHEPFGAVRPETPPEWWPHKPPAAPNFIGRQLDLWKLQSLLLKGSDTTVTAAAPAGRVCIRGMGGMGKTLLAQQYALRFGWAWPGGVYWFDGRGGNRTAGDGYSLHGELDPQFASLARTLGIHTEGMDGDYVRGLVRERLKARQAAYLWIIDDVPPGVPLNDLADWSAPTAHGKTLVSTRSTQYRRADGELELLGLADQPAFTLLTSQRPPTGEAESDAARQIVELLGGHPLALEVAAAAVESTFAVTPYADFLAALEDSGDDALDPDSNALDQLPTGHDGSVVRTLLGSIKLLDEPARNVLLLASQVAEAPIPFDLILRAFDSSISKHDLGGAAKALESHALAKRDNQARTLQVHPIVNYVVRRWREHAAAANALRPGIADALVELLGEVEDVRRHEAIVLPLAHAHALASGDPAAFLHAPLWLALARHDLAIADYAAAECHVLAVYKHAPATGEATHRVTVQALNILADICDAQGRFVDAEAYARQAFETGIEQLGRDDRETLAAMNNLAGTLKAQGDLAGARALEEQALVGRRGVLGDEHPDTLITMNNLAGTLKAQGDLDGAKGIEEQALAVRRRVLGDEHPHTLNAMNNLAITHWSQGDLPGARAILERVLAGNRRVLGDDHPDTLTSMSNLAETLRTQGEFLGARALLEQALAVRRRVLGVEHPATLTAMNNLSLTLKEQRELSGARALQEQVLAGRRRVFSDGHSSTTIAAWNLYLTERDLGHLDAARDLFEQLLCPLLQTDPETLSGDQRQIRTKVQKIVDEGKGET